MLVQNGFHSCGEKTMPGSYVIMTDKMLQIGDQFDRFQILSFLVQGGMSDIYCVYDVITRREVILKIPDRTTIGDPAQYERFQREMEVVTSLNHPALLHGIFAGTYNRTPFLATEKVEGQSLRAMIQDSAPMPEDRVVPLILKIADGLAYCHANNVIHRDLKPENILVTPEGQPVIIDFGLALTKGAHRVTYSNLSTTMGTPDYMAPEQIDGQRGDERTDLYALGTIMFEMLAGEMPFSGDNNLAIMAQHLNGTAPRLDKVKPGVSAAVAAVAARCLAHSPDDRYASMRELIAALEHPETVDLSILDQAGAQVKKTPWWKSAYLKALGLGFGVLIAIIILAFALQSIHK
jgi:serine/threonine protein kinase